MLSLVLRFLASAASLYLAVVIAQVLRFKIDLTGNVGAVFVTVIALALVNAFVRPVVKLLAAPLNCMTLGLFNLVINALMFLLVAYFNVGLRFTSQSLGGNLVAALVASILASVIFSVLEFFVAQFTADRDKD